MRVDEPSTSRKRRAMMNGIEIDYISSVYWSVAVIRDGKATEKSACTTRREADHVQAYLQKKHSLPGWYTAAAANEKDRWEEGRNESRTAD